MATIATKRWIADHGLEPLEVMLDNMGDSMIRAKKLEEKAVLTKEDKIERVRLRAIAQSCACDAAPYVHPKLSSVEMGSGDKGPMKFVIQWGDNGTAGSTDPV